MILQLSGRGAVPISLSILVAGYLLPASAATTAHDDIQLTPAGSAVTVEVLANDIDTEGDPLSTQSPTQGSNGSVGLNGDNTLTYTPNGGHLGRDTFDYTASDGSDTDVATVKVVTNDTFNAETARDDILAGVTTLTDPGGPGHIVVWGPTAYVISNYPGADRSDPMIAAATMGSGKVIAVPDHQWLNMNTHGGDASMSAFYQNGIAWLAGTTSKTTIKVVVYNNTGTRDWLIAQGYTNVVNVNAASLAAELATADVLTGWLGSNPSQAVQDEVSNFVLGGGGLFIQDYGQGYQFWWNKETPDIPGNRILREAGIAFVKNSTHGGAQNINRASGQVTAQDVIDIIGNPGAYSAAEKDEAAVIMQFLIQALPENDLLRARLETTLNTQLSTIIPTPASPVSDDFEKALLVAESQLLLDLTVTEMTAHRAALPVSVSAPRVNTNVTIAEPATGHANLQIDTGLYVPPGEIVTMTFPPALVGIGLRVQIGHLRTDLNDNNFYVMPNQRFFFDVDATSVDVASPHGGLLMIEASSGEEWTGAQVVGVNGAVEIPYFVRGQTTNAQWTAGIRDRGTPFGVLVSDTVVLVVESEQFLRSLGDPVELMDVWRDMIWHVADFYDYDRGRPLRVHHDYQPAGGVSAFPLSYNQNFNLTETRKLIVSGEPLTLHEHGHHADSGDIIFSEFGETSPNLGGKYTQDTYKRFSWKQETPVGRINNYRFSLTDDVYNHFNHYKVDVKVVFVDSLAEVFGWPAIRSIVHTISGMGLSTSQDKMDQWLIQTSLETGFDVHAFLEQWQLSFSPAALAAVDHLPEWNMVEQVADSIVTSQGTPVIFPDPSVNDFSYDGSLSLTSITSPASGTITPNGDGTYTYTPNGGFTGKDPVQYSVTNGMGNVFTATIDITVTSSANFPRMESGRATAGTGSWTPVSLGQTYTSPVVVAQPVRQSGDAPVVTRIRNAGGNSFELRIQRADGSGAAINGVPVHFMVVEAGVYDTTTHGVKMEAGTVSSTVTDTAGNFTGQHLALAHEWEDHYFIPVLFGQVMTYNDTGWTAFWAQSKLDSFTVGKHVGEDPATARANESLGYVVMEAGSLQIGDYWFQCGDIGKDNYAGMSKVQPGGGTINLERAPPLSGALVQPVFSGDPGTSEEGTWAVLAAPGAVGGTSFSSRIVEDQIGDSEQNHDDMPGSYIAFAQFDVINNPPVFDADPIVLPDGIQDLSYAGETSALVLDPDWGDVLIFSKVSGPAWLTLSADGSLSGTPSVSDAGLNQFTVRVQDAAGLFDETALEIDVVGVQAHWKLNDGSGPSAVDSSGNSHTGTLESGAGFIASNLGGAVALDGTDDRIVVTGYKGVSGTQSRTVSAWIKTTKNNAAIVTWGTNSAGQKFTFRVQDTNGTAGALRLEVNGGRMVGTTPVNDGIWHHVAIVVLDDGSPNVNETRLYVDGVYDGSSSSTSELINTASNRDVWIGDDFTSGREFAGEIDDVRIYDSALGDPAIQALYAKDVAAMFYNVWTASHSLSVPDAQFTADTDSDTLDQLTEYSYGGDPDDPTDGALIVPRVEAGPAAGQFNLVYRRRLDAALRGLTYRVLVSESMKPGSWTEATGMTESAAAIDAEFEEVILTFDLATLPGRLFVQVEVLISAGG